MKSRTYSSEAFVLARRDFGEADRIVSVYSKDYGRLSLIAKGVRRPKSRKRGHIEVFNLIKFQAASGKSLDILTEAEIIDGYTELRQSLKKISLSYYLSEVIGKITHEGEPNNIFFNLILNTFNKLKITKNLKKLRINFVSSTLVLLGYWPENKKIPDPDKELESVIERQISSVRVGKRMIK